MKVNEGKLLLLFSGILVGIFIAIFMVNKSLNPATYLSYQDYENMSLDANQLKTGITDTNKNINILNKKIKSYENSDNKNKTITDEMKKEIEVLKTDYGISKVEGPGLTIIISDRNKKVYTDDFDRQSSTVHNVDLLYVVKDLKNSGAEAISINGKRIIGTTSITCEGPVIMLNGQFIVPPFKICAIGDPDAMNFALTTLSDSWYNDLIIRKLNVKIVKNDTMTIGGADYEENTKYAKAVQ